MVFLVWGICLASIVLMLLRPKRIAEYVWVCGGALLLVVTGLLSWRNAIQAVYEGLDVYLFLTGMMLLAEMARYEGVFDWVAGIAVQHADRSAKRLFLLMYLAGTVVTVLLSNDATAVVLTPAVLAAVRRARVEPRPYLLSCAFIANAASFVLPISNPANLVIFGKKLPALLPWLRMFLLPSIVSIIVTYCILRIIEKKDLQEQVAPLTQRMELSGGGRMTLACICIAGLALLMASGFGRPLGAPTCAVGGLALGLLALRDRKAPATIVKSVSWSVLLLVAGLFTIVEALNQAGMLSMTQRGLNWLMQLPDGWGKLVAGSSVALLSNIMNNLPVGLASGTALQQLRSPGMLIHAALIGIDLGPNLSVTGSLATILWLIALRREKVEITPGQFLKAGALLMPVSLLLSLLVLR
ncbi:arsenic transporter [Pseudacidobacterium ailaaui]|jgi:arsenical pump membrane protein|uniref:arsenic transporter n=1 Tax=Pseudacidobacterium ailaaui TaxID=1382359 RepID=UPI000479004B|nr:arsenic transporter [Pseudacidobacterium ailaaui]